MKIINTNLCDFHNISFNKAISMVKTYSKSPDLDIVVTPNIDHMARLTSDPKSPLHIIYGKSSLCICDSKVLQKILLLKDKIIDEVIPGSTLTQALFDNELSSEDRILVIGGSDQVIAKLRTKYSHLTIEHHNPPMGFINKKDEVQEAIDYCIDTNPDYIFLAVGSPRQEILAQKIQATNKCNAVAMCIGASILFLVDEEKRAPLWMQKAHLEWFYRMAQDPQRLVKRYFDNLLTLPKIYKNL